MLREQQTIFNSQNEHSIKDRVDLCAALNQFSASIRGTGKGGINQSLQEKAEFPKITADRNGRHSNILLPK